MSFIYLRFRYVLSKPLTIPFDLGPTRPMMSGVESYEDQRISACKEADVEASHSLSAYSECGFSDPNITASTSAAGGGADLFADSTRNAFLLLSKVLCPIRCR